MRSSRRRRRACHHRAVLDCRWRRSHVRAGVRRADGTLLCGREGSAIARLAVHEVVARGRSHRAWIVRIDEIEIVNVGRVDDVGVPNKGVTDVDPLDKPTAATETGKEGFPKSQREPADSAAKTESESKAPAAKETNERRAVNWGPKERPWAPAPPAAEIIPAAVVERSKAPGLSVNPAPAPWAYPIPITHAVGRPAHVNVTGIPHVSVFRLVAPIAVVVEVGVAGHLARNVLRGDRVVFLKIAFFGPLVQTVEARRLRDVVLRIFSSIELCTFSAVHFIRLAASGNYAFSTNHRDAARVAIFVDVNAKSTSLLHGESEIGRIHFVQIALAQLADAEIDGAFRKAHLDDVFV